MFMNVRVRIAPSPTGEDLHIGNIYTGLINFAFARKNKGKFIIRIEDTDRTRLVEGSEERILKSLKRFGLNYDEGPDKGGPFAPYRQSERKELYQKYAQDLVEKQVAYYCSCSKEKLEELKSKEQKIGEFKRHSLYCDKKKGDSFVIRLKVDDKKDISFKDLIRGKITINTSQIDDQILIKSDGFPTYHLAVVVDDYLMKISHIIRAEEWISSTPKHVLLYEAFEWPLPLFAHVPLLRNSDKSKLSKRSNPVWASWYLEQGFFPEVILNFLSLMGWSHPEGKEIFSLDEFIEKFDIKDLNPVGPIFDLTKLEWMNGEYIRKTQNSKLKIQILEYLKEISDGKLDHPTGEEIEKVIPIIKERIKKLSDFIPLTDFLWEKPEYEKQVFNKLGINNLEEALENILKDLKKMEKPWKADNFEQTFRKLAGDLGLSATQIFQLIRVAVSGQLVTPPLFESIQILGENETLKRFEEVANIIGS